MKPGKVGAFVRTGSKNVPGGKVVDKTFNAGLKVETATVDKTNDAVPVSRGTDFVFTGQRHLTDPGVGNGRRRGQVPGRTKGGRCRQGDAAVRRVACSVELIIRYTEPGLQGDRSTSGTSRRSLETGATINVPFLPQCRRRSGRHSRRLVHQPRQQLTHYHGDNNGRNRQMGARTKARKRALDVLYQADLRGWIRSLR